MKIKIKMVDGSEHVLDHKQEETLGEKLEHDLTSDNFLCDTVLRSSRLVTTEGKYLNPGMIVHVQVERENV